ncbi:MAG: LytTR family DNA-binding domain-containing protein [Bacteroidota bacterium]
MIKTILVDDEALCINSLQDDLVKYCPEIEIVATASSGKEGILAIRKHQPQLIFLDIGMPWMNGFEMLELVEEINFQIIFVTAFDQFAARAFRISAVDYLLKPVDGKELQTAVAKAISNLKHTPEITLVNNLLSNIKLPEQQQKIALPYREGYEFIEPQHILYCEADGAYTRFYFHDDKRVLLISKSLGDIELLLPTNQFQRIHHSTIVNVAYITHFIKTDGGYVQMNSGKRLMISKTRKEALLGRLGLK